MDGAIPTCIARRVAAVGLLPNENGPREPPHIHVIVGVDEVEFWLMPEIWVAYNDGLKPKLLSRALRLVEDNRAAFEEA